MAKKRRTSLYNGRSHLSSVAVDIPKFTVHDEIVSLVGSRDESQTTVCDV